MLYHILVAPKIKPLSQKRRAFANLRISSVSLMQVASRRFSHPSSFHALPPPPLQNPALDLSPAHAVADQPHGDTQRLGIAIAPLVVEEEHLSIRDASALMQRLEMTDLRRGVYLQARIEEINRLPRLVLAAPSLAPAIPILPLGAGKKNDARGRHVQHLEHVAPEVGRRGAARDAEAHAGEGEPVQDRGDVAVEGEGLADLVRAGGVRGVPGAQGRVHVRVDPEGPERVVQVEDHRARQRAAVGQDARERGAAGGGGGGCGCG